MKRTATTALLVALLAACGSTTGTGTTRTVPPASEPAPSSPPAASAPVTTSQVDPYETFQSAAKAQNLEVPPTMTRDDALARALIGCGTTWPPKTLDAVLAQSYATQIAEAKAQGHCK